VGSGRDVELSSGCDRMGESRELSGGRSLAGEDAENRGWAEEGASWAGEHVGRSRNWSGSGELGVRILKLLISACQRVWIN
jgi:hypothetical protein